MVVKIKMESDPIEEPEAIMPMEIESSGDQITTTTTTGRLRRKAASRPNLNPTVAVIKMENYPIEEAEAIIPVEIVSSGDHSDGRLVRKVARRTEP
jgi:tRNA(Ser,Leu) C12 N-acetylase TAN1